MPGVTIRALKDGPYEVRRTVEIVANRPFCDGTHKKVGFQAPECVRLKADR